MLRVIIPPVRGDLGLRLDGVTKLYGSTVALWGIQLTISSRELVAIAGVNGSGKSTLLRVVAGLIAPTRGHVGWVSAPGQRGPRIAYVGHANHLHEALTPLEHVTLYARLARRDPAVAAAGLEVLGLAAVAARPCRDLSAGTLRRVALARALAVDPDVLLVDEPFAAVDDRAATAVAAVLRSAHGDGRLVIVSGHEAGAQMAGASRWIALAAGRVVSDSPVVPERRPAAVGT